MTLLILDRESRSRRQLYDLFASRFDTVAVASIFAAFRLLRHRSFDAVLAKSGGMDGFAIAMLKWIQIHRLAISTIALLARGARDEGDLLRQLGARSILRWPASNRDVVRAVAAVQLSWPSAKRVCSAPALAVADSNGTGSNAGPVARSRPCRVERREASRRRHWDMRRISRLGAPIGTRFARRN